MFAHKIDSLHFDTMTANSFAHGKIKMEETHTDYDHSQNRSDVTQRMVEVSINFGFKWHSPFLH